MNIFLYYFDKITAWLDFSWLINSPKYRTNANANANANAKVNDPPPYENENEEEYICDPLLRIRL